MFLLPEKHTQRPYKMCQITYKANIQQGNRTYDTT